MLLRPVEQRLALAEVGRLAHDAHGEREVGPENTQLRAGRSEHPSRAESSLNSRACEEEGWIWMRVRFSGVVGWSVRPVAVRRAQSRPRAGSRLCAPARARAAWLVPAPARIRTHRGSL